MRRALRSHPARPEDHAVLAGPHEVLPDPGLLAGKTPAAVEQQIGGHRGWRTETPRRVLDVAQGWVLRGYDDAGNPTGSVIRWHPGGGHHGSDPYWRVSSPRYGRSEEIRWTPRQTMPILDRLFSSS